MLLCEVGFDASLVLSLRWFCRFASLAGFGASLRSLVLTLRCARWIWRFAALAGFDASLRSLGLGLL